MCWLTRLPHLICQIDNKVVKGPNNEETGDKNSSRQKGKEADAVVIQPVVVAEVQPVVEVDTRGVDNGNY